MQISKIKCKLIILNKKNIPLSKSEIQSGPEKLYKNISYKILKYNYQSLFTYFIQLFPVTNVF